MKKHYGWKIGDMSCNSNLDKWLSDFGSFLVIELLLYIYLIFLYFIFLHFNYFTFNYYIFCCFMFYLLIFDFFMFYHLFFTYYFIVYWCVSRLFGFCQGTRKEGGRILILRSANASSSHLIISRQIIIDNSDKKFIHLRTT